MAVSHGNATTHSRVAVGDRVLNPNADYRQCLSSGMVPPRGLFRQIPIVVDSPGPTQQPQKKRQKRSNRVDSSGASQQSSQCNETGCASTEKENETHLKSKIEPMFASQELPRPQTGIPKVLLELPFPSSQEPSSRRHELPKEYQKLFERMASEDVKLQQWESSRSPLPLPLFAREPKTSSPNSGLSTEPNQKCKLEQRSSPEYSRDIKLEPLQSHSSSPIPGEDSISHQPCALIQPSIMPDTVKREPSTQSVDDTHAKHKKEEELLQRSDSSRRVSPVKNEPQCVQIASSQNSFVVAVAEAQKRFRDRQQRIDEALNSWRPEVNFEAGQSMQSPMCALNHGVPLTQEHERQNLMTNSQTQDPNPAKVDLDPYQAAAVDAAINGESFFLTGSAGTGKSFVLKQIIIRLREKGKRVAVTASTGCSAVALQGGTIHSFSGVGLGMDPIGTLEKRAKKDASIRNRLQKCNVLVIDEVSMIDSFLFDKIEIMFRAGRAGMAFGSRPSKKRKQRSSEKDKVKDCDLFGGVQVITCGDFFQLPPVAASDYKFQMSREKYFAFESKIWRRKIRKNFMLRVVHRQSNRSFVGLLNEVRYGIVSQNTKDVLSACHIDSSQENTELDNAGNTVLFTRLFSLRRQVDTENSLRLRRITNQPGVRYEAVDKIYRGSDEKDLDGMPFNVVKKLLNQVNGLESLDLKQGCRVLCTKNVDRELGIVNGSCGYIIGYKRCGAKRFEEVNEWLRMDDKEREETYKQMTVDGISKDEVVSLRDKDVMKDYEKVEVDPRDGFMLQSGKEPELVPVVQFENGVTMAMVPLKWEIYGMRGRVIARRFQIPLILGWALSIHKSQGMTLKNVQTDLRTAFDYGQVYVALSRATSAHGLRVTSFDSSKVKSHAKVQQFYNGIEKVDQNQNELSDD